MGLANICVPHEQLDVTVQEWAETICERSPTAIAIAKRSFNMDTAHQSGIAGMGMYALKLYYDTEESREGGEGFAGKAQARLPQVRQVTHRQRTSDESQSLHQRRPAGTGRDRAPRCR